MDVFIILAMNEPPLVRHHYPSVDEARATIKAHNDGTQPLEPYQLISQYTLEPLLKSEVEALPSVTLRYAHEFLSFDQDEGGVSMQVKTPSGNRALTFWRLFVVTPSSVMARVLATLRRSRGSGIDSMPAR